MDTQKLVTVFYCFMAAGTAIPLLSIVVGAIGGAVDASMDIDADVDADGGPAPFNLMCLCLAAVLFGAVGRLCLMALPWWASILVGLLAGVAGGYLLGRFVILPLKRNDCRAFNIDRLKGAKGTVRLEIRRDFIGTVTLLSAMGSQVTYDATPVQGVDKILAGVPVLVVGVEENRDGRKVCVVMPTQ